jgi:hypothetical protein
MNEDLIESDMFTKRERDVVQKLRRPKASAEPVEDDFVLGGILVASGEITQDQLEGALLRQTATGRRLGEELIMSGHASHGQIENGLVLQRKLIAYALVATVGLGPISALMSPAEAGQSRAAMQVSVMVVANAKIQSSYQATQLKISEADVARGYVEIPGASRFSVATNSRTGYLMEFQPVGNIFQSVQVAGLGNAVQLGADGGAIVQRGPSSPALTHELSFRFTLAPNTSPGLYPWPLQLSVRAL